MSYKLTRETPAFVNVSGGRTSAYLALKIRDANPNHENIEYLFQNTGRERDETLEFVNDLSIKGGLPVTWVEYRSVKPKFEVVNFETASRWQNPRPFDQLITDKKNYLPNRVQRFCTEELKVKTARRYIRSKGFNQYITVVGFRADEPLRVKKLQKRVVQAIAKMSKVDNRKRLVELPITPLFENDVTVKEVSEFWKRSNFDLNLPMLPCGKTAGGNCIGCFLHSEADRAAVAREEPEKWAWLIDKEFQVGGTFVNNLSAEELQKRANTDLVKEYGDDNIFCITPFGGCHEF